MSETIFLAIYGNPALQAAVGFRPESIAERRAPKSPLYEELLSRRIGELRAKIDSGGLQECILRGLLYVAMARGRIDERGASALRQIRISESSRMTLAQFKAMAREQFLLLILDQEGTLAAIPKLLPDDLDGRRKGFGFLRQVVSASGEATGEAAKRLGKLAELFGIVEPRTAEGPSVPLAASAELPKAS